ncbi:osmoprotectant transport system substrate-binding protein [Quadrisphaera granulorum]|uniref:Osmoprotectant transport system substrate-binding protein n=1 Tax=Quadrisphaera granulorum TaxID=317664 RepID=A0A316A7U4_9ACTN|nr:ABC transporter substrate-binding protein [Quadrisphaera granulorum]PWJ53298.1 osmoprotectant transport system substrate-binding protein [Quadrisphaera granulorum]SZE96972.1 osmoprotectant transport system substrate-binding protein [Quadrisphaera granulorum]
MTSFRTRSRASLLLAGVASAVLALSSCAANDVQQGSTATSTSGGATQTIVVGGPDFTEASIMEQLYAQLLQGAGYKTQLVTSKNREVYFGELAKGNIDVVPEYAATLAEYLNQQKNGKSAAPIATNDAAATVAAAQPLANAQGVTLLEPAKAADQNAFAVTQKYASQNNLKTLSDLGALGQPVVLAATEECPQRPFCQPGLQGTYGIKISSVLPTDFDSPATKQAVQNGEAQLGLVASTSGTLDQYGLVVLEDDKKLQLADNLVPAVSKEVVNDPRLTEALNKLASVLTTADLKALNGQVDGERLLPADVAKTYLQDKGLIKG